MSVSAAILTGKNAKALIPDKAKGLLLGAQITDYDRLMKNAFTIPTKSVMLQEQINKDKARTPSARQQIVIPPSMEKGVREYYIAHFEARSK